MEYQFTVIKKVSGSWPDLKILQDIASEIEKICEDTIRDVVDNYARKRREEALIDIERELTELETMFREELAPSYVIIQMQNKAARVKITFRSITEWMANQEILDEKNIVEVSLELELKRMVTKSAGPLFPDIKIYVIWQKKYRNEIAIRVAGPNKEFVDSVIKCFYKILGIEE